MKINNFKDLQVELTALPFKSDYLEPYMSRETLDYHYNKHHQAYVTKTLSLLVGEKTNKSLLDIIREAKVTNNKILYNNSAQILNHHIFWLSLTNQQNGVQQHKEKELIEDQWGDYETFGAEFVNKGIAQFGSGWVWLLKDPSHDNKMFIETSANGDIPDRVLHNEVDIVTLCDLWEHAYYIDYRNERNTFIKVFVDHLIKFI